MSEEKEKEKQKKETWRLWDAIFTSSFISLFNDAEEAKHDEKKFKSLLYQFLFGIVFTVILFAVLFWIFT